MNAGIKFKKILLKQYYTAFYIKLQIYRAYSILWFIYDNFKNYDISISNKNIGGTYEKGWIKNE